MHVLIATAGALPPGPVADLTERMLADEGQVTVVTVIEVPRSFLDGLEAETWHPFDEDREASNQQAAIVERYVEERGRKLAEPVLAALRARGIEPHGIFVEGADRAAAICDTADQVEADLIMMGATRHLFGEGAWESISDEVMRRTRLPLLLVPGLPRPDTGAEPDAVPGAHETN